AIAGITPMDGMLDVMKLPDEQRPWRIGDDKTGDWKAMREGRAPESQKPKDDTGLAPIATPLSIGGMNPAVREYFSPWLQAHGFEPMASGSAGSGAKPVPLQPGSAI